MAQNNIRATLIIRNDTASNWSTKNPILAKGEMGAEIDTGLLKLGDGSTAFNSLSYINNGRSGDGALITVVNDKLTVANYGYSYWQYDTSSMQEEEIIEPDLTKWPALVELEVKNGQARWVKPKATYNRTEGTIEGILVTLARDPQNSNEATTKGYVDSTIASAIANADHLKRKIVTELPTLGIEPNTIYMIKDNSVTGGDKYKEYLLIDNVLAQIGDTSVDLSNYLQKPTVQTAGNLVSIAADGSLIDSGISSTNVGQLDIATTTVLGGVRSSTSDNAVSVNSITGVMTVNNISTTKLYVPAGDELILNGGQA